MKPFSVARSPVFLDDDGSEDAAKWTLKVRLLDEVLIVFKHLPDKMNNALNIAVIYA